MEMKEDRYPGSGLRRLIWLTRRERWDGGAPLVGHWISPQQAPLYLVSLTLCSLEGMIR